jgi:hypothetical protein
MTDRSMRATGLVALALSLALVLYAWSFVDQSRRAVAMAAARAEVMRAILDRTHAEIAELKAMLNRLDEAERDRARRAGRAPWRGRID